MLIIEQSDQEKEQAEKLLIFETSDDLSEKEPSLISPIKMKLEQEKSVKQSPVAKDLKAILSLIGKKRPLRRKSRAKSQQSCDKTIDHMQCGHCTKEIKPYERSRLEANKSRIHFNCWMEKRGKRCPSANR